jgi:phage shock protein C
MANNKKLERSNDRWIAGVCSGIANYFGWDPAIVRIVWLVLSICSIGFPGIIAYLILWIIMPAESSIPKQ